MQPLRIQESYGAMERESDAGIREIEVLASSLSLAPPKDKAVRDVEVQTEPDEVRADDIASRLKGMAASRDWEGVSRTLHGEGFSPAKAAKWYLAHRAKGPATEAFVREGDSLPIPPEVMAHAAAFARRADWNGFLCSLQGWRLSLMHRSSLYRAYKKERSAQIWKMTAP